MVLLESGTGFVSHMAVIADFQQICILFSENKGTSHPPNILIEFIQGAYSLNLFKSAAVELEFTNVKQALGNTNVTSHEWNLDSEIHVKAREWEEGSSSWNLNF